MNLSLADGDVDEVTHRFNAFLHALAPLRHLPLGDFEPSPVAPEAGT